MRPVLWRSPLAPCRQAAAGGMCACSRGLLDAERVGRGCVLLPATPWVQALAGAVCAAVFAVTGIVSESLRAVMPRPLGGTRCGMNHAGYDLAGLRLNGLIYRVPRPPPLHLHPDGLGFAVFYSTDHGRLLRPLLAADQPPTPPELCTAPRAVDQHINQRLTHARLPTAA